jgi:hypothetical protein
VTLFFVQQQCHHTTIKLDTTSAAPTMALKLVATAAAPVTAVMTTTTMVFIFLFFWLY